MCGPDRCEIPFKLRGGTPLRNLKQILGARRDLPLHAFRLFYQGDEVRDTDTATALGMQDGAVIHIAHIHRTRERGRTRKCEECCARSVQKLIDDVVGGRP